KYLWHFENKNFWRNDYTFGILKQHINPLIDYAVKKILASNARIIGFSVVDPKERITIELIKRIKEKNPEKIIILGGPACSTEDSRGIFVDRLPNLVDAYVINEGEDTLMDILDACKKGRSLENIPGAILHKDGRYSNYLSREHKEDVNEFPFPTYNGFDLKQYTTHSLTLEWSRGCIADCAFCKIKGLWKGYRYRKPENIVGEIEHHVRQNGITQFTVTDPTFNGDIKKLEKVCDLIIQKNLKIKWFGQAIPSNKMTVELLTKMKKSGCYKIEYGVESGSNKVLKNMRKPYTREIIEGTLKRTHEVGIPVFIFTMIGYPSETEEDFQMTLDFIRKNQKYITAVKSVNMLHLIDDTDVYEKREEFGIKILDEAFRHIHWVSDNGENTYEVRKNRTERMLTLLKELNIPMLETNLKEAKEAKMLVVDGGSIEASFDEKFDFFKKQIADIDGTLYHPNPESILSGNKEKKVKEQPRNIVAKKTPKVSKIKPDFGFLKIADNFIKNMLEKSKLVDVLNLGNKESEIKHPPLGSWVIKTPAKNTHYTGPDNIKYNNYCRDFIGWTGVTLKIPPNSFE
ncbi:MAG: radical SAM protein, partial [Nanoarchaeota archaeon]